MIRFAIRIFLAFVAVGILLALQVNIWNENRLKHVQEIQLLKRLSEDLINDPIYYNKRISYSNSAIDGLTKYIKKSYE